MPHPVRRLAVRTAVIPAAALAAAAVSLAPAGARAQQPAASTSADTLTVAVPLRPPGGATDGRFLIFTTRGVSVVGDTAGTLAAAPGDTAVRLPVLLRLDGRVRAGTLNAGRVQVTWADGRRSLADIVVQVGGEGGRRTLAARVAPLARDLFVDLVASPTAAPGGDVKLILGVYSYEDVPLRIRLRLDDAAGFRPLDRDFGDERTLEAGDEINAELHLEAPREVRDGESRIVRLFAEVVGEPGAAEAMAPVRIMRGGGLRAGQSGLGGSVQLASRGVDLGAGERGMPSGSLDLSGKLDRRTSVSVTVRRGLSLTQAPILGSYVDEQDRIAVDLRRPGWILTGGNQLLSSGGTLAGPFARGQGLTLRRTVGRTTGDLVVARPVSFTGDVGGRLARGSVGTTTRVGRVAVTFSDLARPGNRYSPGSEAIGGGLDAALQRGTRHRLLVRAGVLRLAHDTGFTVTGGSFEGQYAFTSPRATANLRRRVMPPGITGLALAGDETSVDGSVTVARGLRASARAYRNAQETLGQRYAWAGEGVSGGLMVTSRAGHRLDLRGNHREATSAARTVQRTATLSAGMPLGPVTLDAMADVGRQTIGTRAAGIRSYRAGVRWFDEQAGSLSSGVSYHDYGTTPPRLRADLAASVRVRGLEVDGGGWVTRGPSFGGNPVGWANAVAPLPFGFGVIVGGEYVRGRVPYTRYVDPATGIPLPPEVADDPTQARLMGVPVDVPAAPFRLTLGVRRRLVLALPGTGAARPPR